MTIALSVAASLILFQGAQSAIDCPGPFSLDQLVTLHVEGVPASRVAALVDACGVSFSATSETEAVLRAVGATEAVLAAVREASTHADPAPPAASPGIPASQPHEATDLVGANIGMRLSQFDLRAKALRFGEVAGGRDHKIVVEVPIHGLEMRLDESADAYNLHLSLTATIRRSDGTILQRYVEEYPLTGPAQRADALRLGNVVFKRRLALPAGEFSLDVTAQDHIGGRSSAVSEEFAVTRAKTGPCVSSLVVVRRVDDLPEGTASDDPLDLFHRKRIVPNLGAPISRALNPKLWLFFMAYPPTGASQPPAMALEFRRRTGCGTIQ